MANPLNALLKVAPKAYPKLRSMLIDIQQYKPTWLVGGPSAAPLELAFTSSTTSMWEEEPDKPLDLDAIQCTENALGRVSLPPKAHFVLGKAVHMQFDSGS